MAEQELPIGLEEKYVIEKYEGDVQTPENLLERITIVNDVIVSHEILKTGSDS